MWSGTQMAHLLVGIAILTDLLSISAPPLFYLNKSNLDGNTFLCVYKYIIKKKLVLSSMKI